MCVRAGASGRARGRERVNGWRREESAEKGREGRGGGLCSETETNDHEHETTHISTQSQRYRKEDQIGTRVHSGEQRDDSSEREHG